MRPGLADQVQGSYTLRGTGKIAASEQKERPGMDDPTSPRFRYGGTCDGKEIHHTTYLRATSPETTLQASKELGH